MPTETVATPEHIQGLFNRIAPHYDDLNQQLSWGWHHVWKTMTVLWAAPPWGGRVLDICCGSGDLALILARKVGHHGQVVGLDFSSALLARAQQRSRIQYPLHQFEWIEGDALALPFAADSFAAITLGYGLRNVVDIPRCLAEIARVLQPGATVAILDFQHPDSPWIAQAQQWYLNTVVVPKARHVGMAAEYDYIAPSVLNFPPGATQVALAQDAGLQDCHFYPLLGGMMGVLVAKKPARPSGL